MSSSNMSTPAAKRRRVSAANATLRKPFQSPVIRRPVPAPAPAPADDTTPGPGTNSGRVSDAAVTSSRLSGVDDDIYPASSPSVPRQLGAMRQTRTAASPLLRLSGTPPPPGPARPGGKRKPFGSRAGAVGPGGGEGDDGGGDGSCDNPFTALVRAHRTSGQDAMIRGVDRQLETVQQASKIEGASERRKPGEPVDQELRDLVVRWRGASRVAADELFELVRGRVDSSGGPRAWRAMQARQMEFYRGLDAEVPARSGSGGGVGEEEEGGGGGYARDEVESLLEKEQRLEGDERVKDDEIEDEDEPVSCSVTFSSDRADD